MKKLALSTAMLIALATSPSVAKADQDISMQQLQKQMQVMMQRIEALEAENKKLKTNINTVEHKVAKHAPKTAPKAKSDGVQIPGTNTTVKLGGYVKADFIADVSNGYGADFAKFASIPLDGSTADGKSSDFHAHIKNTRINMTGKTPTPMGELKTFVEVDFFGNARGSDLVTNNHNLEIRQAYGQVGGLLAGQTWTNFADLAAWPESLDFGGPAGVTIMRQAQLRYSGKLDDDLSYSVSLENPFSDVNNGSGDTISGHERVPDLVGAITKKGDWGHVSARGVLRDISIENETTGADYSEFGYGVSLTSKLNIGEKDNLRLRASYGDGIGRYIYDVAVSGQGAGYNAGQLETQEVFSGYASYQHHWTDTLRSNLMGGYTHIDNATSLVGTTDNETIASGHLNLIWQPLKQYKVGLEYMHGHRELDDGTEGQLDRLQASFIYSLN